MLNEFQVATHIISGTDSLSELQNLSLKKVLIVCDPYMVNSGKVEIMTSLFVESGVEYTIFSDISPDPTIDIVTKGLVSTLSFEPDSIVALGGGSAMDAAKAIRYIYQMIKQTLDVSLVCIPTTSGTGSEVTSFSVISDPSTDSKYALVDKKMIPNVAILDPKIVLTVPKNITADTGIDVFTHCIEALASTKANDFTDANSEKAIKIIWNDLVKAYNDGDNLIVREMIHNASCLAGIAFNEASLGICHSLAHALGGKFHIPHGRANALLLPHVIAYNAELDNDFETSNLETYYQIANVLGVRSGTKKSTVYAFISKLQRLMKQLDLPQTIEEFEIDKDDFISAIPEMAQKAMKDQCTITNPRQPQQADLENIYSKLLRGGY
ncbi:MULTISPECIES: 1-propanol dehydrogenase PduQ [unclassified Vagococcus]|uniref:1-propanol dehydrogenase PduQ n=1 Tax=unclassified Vagococcus TaxID=2648499 RepID=UPI001F510A16|nr:MULTISPECIES: 1-propanol dehydrogenase PduQ [unclassified Vagococcus]MCI0130373.1 iron-containing alcohol dehydrogenase [Vagococcus sp. CY53-2]UNM89808.1 iron-containing alcohol dehydrogenase [Vagococcus sp. CY52-2]